MRYLLDTGILLRLVNRQAEKHEQVRHAVSILKSQGHMTFSALQNRAEFWNVCTRPITARGGFGLTLDETQHRLRTIERIAPLITEPPDAYEQWKTLVVMHEVRGVQVHDARLAAIMLCHEITHILTLNVSDFTRYPHITAVAPEDILAHSH